MQRKLLFAAAVMSLTLAASAQQSSGGAPKAQAEEHGWTSSMSFEGNIDSQQRVFDLNSSVGYNLSKHWGADVGVPFEFVSSSATSGTVAGAGKGKSNTTGSSNSLQSVGNAFGDVRFSAKTDVLNYNSVLTAWAPTGSEAHGVSTGRTVAAWNNHLEHGFARLTPFIEAGIGNTVMETRLYHRPFTTLGFVSQFSGGSSFDLGRDFSIGISLYDVLPAGQQKLYSKLVSRGAQAIGKGNHGRAYELAAETVGNSLLTRDNGDSAWVDYSPGVFDFEVGYTHSVHYAINTFAFSAEVNLRKLMRRASAY